ncbi:helix-turn-helix transcriptional regulator [Isobaculum melis]|uniref:Predicted DNA-binding transcriptional regulator YafY, contains an HTH and WYL domains n=1 Tax=Isobaculum melis TaxID=142588 RepID=A0A1H9STP6_9LACT|nr:YafY family protein [Isobaculum melis]SER88234.1 Predicted DNA-binding transcriptional regulator YafY, contains an HTH and WYL domains [Isobaculum melis]
MRLERLMQIVFILLNRRKVTATELAQHFQVSARTIYRDIDALSLAGFPVFAIQGTNGGYQLIDNYGMDLNFFKPDDFQVMMQMSASMATLYQDQEAQEMMDKMAVVNPQKTEQIADFSYLDARNKEKRFLLQQSILQHQVVCFSYAKKECAEERIVKPLQLFFHHLYWYVYGFCTEKNDYRVFKLARIFNLEITDEVFTDDFTQTAGNKQFNQWLINMGDNRTYHELRLLFPKEKFQEVYDHFPDTAISRTTDGKILVEMNYPDEAWVHKMILGFEDQVEVLAPLSLKKTLANKVKKMYLHYYSEPDN